MKERISLLLALTAICLIKPVVASEELDFNENDPFNLYKDLFRCQLTFSKRPDIYKVELIAYNLLLPHQKKRITTSTVISQVPENKLGISFERLDFTKSSTSPSNSSNLHLSTLDPSLPFTFFINGFNHNGAIGGSWFEGAADALVRQLTMSDSSTSSRQQKSNILFLSWRVTGIISSDAISMPLAYYRTMANYDLVMDEIAQVLVSIVDYIEETKGGGSWHGPKGAEMARAIYYSKFSFYAHSLGSHLMSNAIEVVHESRPWVRFGKIVGLDPALPCFLDDNHGLSADRLNQSVSQVVVVHSNAAFSGVYSERGNMDIVLNGGTFQPGCHWLDFTCSHVRSNDIFTYVDDQCEMVAYWCSKYEQFKNGACETCDTRRNGSQEFSNCVLVNLPEQHVDSSEFLDLENGDDTHVRQLAFDYREVSDGDSGDDYRKNSTKPIVLEEIDSITKPKLTKRFGFHFVNTNPYYISQNTHCLQHYQLRLLTLAENRQGQTSKCPLSSYYRNDHREIQVKLLYETIDNERKLFSSILPNLGDERLANPRATLDNSSEVDGKILTPIVYDKLYTGLITFPGKPELFIGSIIDSIDLNKWSKCLIKEKVLGEIRFTLDIAFMSHTKSR